MEINKTIKDLKTASDGKKTYVAGALALLFDIVNDLLPELMTSEKEATVQKILFYIIYYGVLDKIWRNRQDIVDFIIKIKDKLFKNKEKK